MIQGVFHGSNNEEDGRKCIYYGLCNNKFSCFDISEVKQHLLQIVTLSDVSLGTKSIEVIPVQSISRTNLEKIYKTCPAWRKRFRAKINNTSIFKEEIEFTDTEVKEMFDTANSTQTVILQQYFSKPITDNIAIKKGAFTDTP